MVTQETREVTIAVKGGTTTREIIGADLRFERYTDVHQKVYRVSHIKQGSPAQKCGLEDGQMS